MLQDQKTQMTHSNNTIIEEVSEQQLHAITGGCSDCEVLARAAAMKSKDNKQWAATTDTTRMAVYYAKKARELNNLSKDASETANAPVPAGEKCCEYYQQHLEKFTPLFTFK
jgi:hypothetical protein